MSVSHLCPHVLDLFPLLPKRDPATSIVAVRIVVAAASSSLCAIISLTHHSYRGRRSSTSTEAEERRSSGIRRGKELFATSKVATLMVMMGDSIMMRYPTRNCKTNGGRGAYFVLLIDPSPLARPDRIFSSR